MKKAPKDVDEYIEGAPKQVQGKLGELPIMDGNDKASNAIDVVKNIMERKRLGKELRETKALYEILLENIPILTLIFKA